MLIDITLEITPAMVTDAQGNERKSLTGHLGTHFDVMDREFPLEYTRRRGVSFDARGVSGRDIGLSDIDIGRVEKDMFVSFCTGYIEKTGYGSRAYFTEHPQLSDELIDALLDREVSVIGVDFAGIRRGREHTPKDQHCADRGAFVVENLCNLEALPVRGGFTAHTYPMRFAGMTGLPCRVIAEVL
ncbi:MAG: cyclase family protein [Oscillospiraceae bacterium]|nr:cyclase family protein [Oscillospiraceae bacterium]